jgi:hypothetical protein
LDIDCVQKAIIFRKAGADVITPDVNINRDLTLLKKNQSCNPNGNKADGQ